MSTATMNGKKLVSKDDMDVVISGVIAAESAGIKPELPSVQEQADPPQQTVDKASLLRAYEESFDRSVKAIGGILDNTALSVYCQVGADCFDTIFRAKNLHDAATQERLKSKEAKSDWSAGDYDDQCFRLSSRCRLFFPHLFAPSKEASDEAEAKGRKKDPVRVSDYILACKAVEVIRAVVGDCIDNLSYFLVANYIARKAVSFSRTDLTCTMRGDWAEFVRIEIPRVASGQILVRDFLNQLNSHEVKLADAKKHEKTAGKTADQIAKAEADEALKKKTRDAATRESKVRTALSTSLADGLAGVLTPAEIGAIISKSATDAKVSLPGALNPETGTASDILDLLKGMFMLKRFDEIRTVCTACADMATMLDRFDSKPQAERKAG